MRWFLVLLPVMAFLAGCGSDSARAYYQARYIPTSGDEIFSSSSKEGWKGDRQVYELPANDPGDYHPRRDCELPGPKFKAQTMASYGGEVVGNKQSDLTVAGGWDDRPEPVAALPPLRAYPVAAQGNPTPSGFQPSQVLPIGGYDNRPLSYGMAKAPATPVGVLGDRPKTDYCLLPEATPPASQARR